jgi:hypothetical protein
MSFLQGDFIDAKNIIIIDGIPHFSLNGKSYLERLKNGLSFDLVFEMEDFTIKQDDIFEEVLEEKQVQSYKYELFDEEYDYDISINNNRKGKNFINNRNIRNNRNTKKNKIRQNGYDDKHHVVETNLPSIYDPDRDLEYYPFDIYELFDKNIRDYDNFYYYDEYNHYNNNFNGYDDDDYSYSSYN